MLLTALLFSREPGGAGRRHVAFCPSCRGVRGLLLSSFVEFKSLFGGRRRLNPGQLGYSQYPSGPGMKSATAHSDPACVPPIPWLPSRGTQIWPPLGVCRSSKYDQRMHLLMQLYGRKGDENLECLESSDRCLRVSDRYIQASLPTI